MKQTSIRALQTGASFRGAFPLIGSFWDMLKKFYIPKKIEVNVRCDIRFEGKVFARWCCAVPLNSSGRPRLTACANWSGSSFGTFLGAQPAPVKSG